MSNEFIREDQYIVFKISDLGMSSIRYEILRLEEEYTEYRRRSGKEPLTGVFIEKDWPEYEPTWKAIEACVTGAQPAPSEQDESVRKSWARFSHELHRSPDAPYPGMADAFEQHFSQSFIDRKWRAEASTWAAAWKAAKRHGAQPVPSINEAVRKVTPGFRWESEAQHHIPTIEIEFEPVSPESPNDAKSWQDRDRLAAMLTPEAKS